MKSGGRLSRETKIQPKIKIKSKITIKMREEGGGIHVQGAFDPSHRNNLGKHGGFYAFDPSH